MMMGGCGKADVINWFCGFRKELLVYMFPAGVFVRQAAGVSARHLAG